eukprot:TRINITY_DN1072_c0_g1_i11.p1 TRINITY_DN1072_c0_g1~~TRINITY_DN1072_c0_g1_i11.p1  ORF type:complete len:336 (-),score=42.89 TRINITY_DN1072_c0_g1_i11:100-1107(-)
MNNKVFDKIPWLADLFRGYWGFATIIISHGFSNDLCNEGGNLFREVFFFGHIVYYISVIVCIFVGHHDIPRKMQLAVATVSGGLAVYKLFVNQSREACNVHTSTTGLLAYLIMIYGCLRLVFELITLISAYKPKKNPKEELLQKEGENEDQAQGQETSIFDNYIKGHSGEQLAGALAFGIVLILIYRAKTGVCNQSAMDITESFYYFALAMLVFLIFRNLVGPILVFMGKKVQSAKDFPEKFENGMFALGILATFGFVILYVNLLIAFFSSSDDCLAQSPLTEFFMALIAKSFYLVVATPFIVLILSLVLLCLMPVIRQGFNPQQLSCFCLPHLN